MKKKLLPIALLVLHFGFALGWLKGIAQNHNYMNTWQRIGGTGAPYSKDCVGLSMGFSKNTCAQGLYEYIALKFAIYCGFFYQTNDIDQTHITQWFSSTELTAYITLNKPSLTMSTNLLNTPVADSSSLLVLGAMVVCIYNISPSDSLSSFVWQFNHHHQARVCFLATHPLGLTFRWRTSLKIILCTSSLTLFAKIAWWFC